MTPDHLGPYRIVRKLGRGGMGMVFLGVDDAVNQTAAVKLLSGDMAHHPDFRERFKAEIETLRKLHHPNIVQIFGYGEQDGEIFYAMEYVAGSSLETQLERGRVFQWREVAQFGVQIARALRHAHNRGVIHRDIKPGNLLVTEADTAKLSDFGIARLFWKSRMTGIGNVMGTAEFMAAEQAEGRAVDPRSDLYSLGAVLYVLLTRRPLYDAKSFAEMLHKQRSERPAPLRSLVADVPAEFEKIIHRLLEKDPDRRFATATVLERRLEAMLESLSLPAAAANPGIDHITIHPAPSDGSPDAESLPVNPLAVTVDATHCVDEVATDSSPAELHSVPEKPPEEPDAAEPDLAASVPASAPASADESAGQAAASGRFVSVRPGELDSRPVEPTEPPWISPYTWFLVAGLVAVWLLAWYMLQPPSANALYRRIERQMADASSEDFQQAEDQIGQFLDRFSDDPRSAELRLTLEQVQISDLEKRLRSLANGVNLRPPSPLERYYIDALAASRSDVDLGLVKFRAMVDLFESNQENSAKERHCIEAAKRRIKELAKQSETQHQEQLTAVKKRLDSADALAAGDPQRAERIRAAVIELYAGKPWANEIVERARKGTEKP